MFMRALRRLWRIPLIFIWALWHAVYSLCVNWPHSREKRIRLMARQMKRWASGLLPLFGVELHVHGNTARYEQTGGLVVSNHTGYMDVFTEAAVFGMRFCPKKEIRSWPVFGLYTAIATPIWVDRTSPRKSEQTLQEFRETLTGKIPLIVYPEGTSTSGRTGLLPFKSTPFEAVAGTSIPVQPILVFYRTAGPGDLNPAWYGDVDFLPHLWALLGNRKIISDLYILEQYHAPGDFSRKQIAEAVREKMVSAYEKILPEIEAGEKSS